MRAAGRTSLSCHKSLQALAKIVAFYFLRRTGRKLIRSDATRVKHLLRHRRRRHGVPPAGVEREMRDDFGKLGRLDAIIERPVEIRRQLRGLITRDQRGDRDEATISRRQIRAFPNLAEGRFGITLKCGRYHANRVSVFIAWGIWVCAHVILLLSDFLQPVDVLTVHGSLVGWRG